MNRLRARLTSDDGISVIELVVASAISLLVLVGALQMVDSAFRTERAQGTRHEALMEVRGAMARLTKELRQVVSIDPSSTRNRLDVQTRIGGVERHALYELSNGEFSRTLDDGVAVAIAERVKTTHPFCYDPPDCTLDSPPLYLTSVRISIGVEPAADSSEPVSLATEVELRNL